MRLSSILAACLALASCNLDPAGKPCETDDDCGSGFDCFPDVCVRVCTKDDECGKGETCFRYHCTVPGQEQARRSRPPARTEAPQPARDVPPLPDATAAELRAIRRELELLRRDVQQLLANQPATQKQPAPGKPPKEIQLPPSPKPAPAPK